MKVEEKSESVTNQKGKKQQKKNQQKKKDEAVVLDYDLCDFPVTYSDP
jgi:hypothetical protein